MDILDQIAVKVEAGDMEAVESFVKECIDQNMTADDILSKGLVGGMLSIGVKFKNNTVFIPEVLVAARAMKAGLALLKPLMKDDSASAKAKILIGTVKGDLHDIGKNIVCAMLEGAGFTIVDLGIDVPKEKFVEAIQNEHPQILGLSALLTTTMGEMKQVIDATEEAGLRDKVKIVVGGAPVSQEFSDEINADAYASDAGVAVDIVNQLLQ
jgi:5-methyltetrahydrofolate--homocysteine methyltransferase